MDEKIQAEEQECRLIPGDARGLDFLSELARDMRWSWNHTADEVWQQLDPVQWELARNPWYLLQTVSREKIQKVLDDPAFCGKISALMRAKKRAENTPAWFQKSIWFGTFSNPCESIFFKDPSPRL